MVRLVFQHPGEKGETYHAASRGTHFPPFPLVKQPHRGKHQFITQPQRSASNDGSAWYERANCLKKSNVFSSGPSLADKATELFLFKSKSVEQEVEIFFIGIPFIIKQLYNDKPSRLLCFSGL